jgi:hypothetical protein
MKMNLATSQSHCAVREKLKDACVTFIVTHGVRVEVRPEWEDLAVEVQDEIRGKIGVARGMEGK